MKRIGAAKLNRPFSLAATLGFVLLAVGFVVGCVLIVGSMLGPREATPPEADSVSLPELSSTPELEHEAAAIRVPEGGRLSTPTPHSTPADTPLPPAEPTPTPTPMPVISAPAFSEARMDFIILGFDATHHADAVCVVSVDQARCTVLSLPRNTLTRSGGALYEADTPAGVFTGVRSVFPVYLKHYVEMDMSGLAGCIDALGGVTLDGALRTGREAAAYLEAGGSDELLRITRQQTLLCALVAQMRELGLLRLLSAKHAMQKCTEGNLTTAQYIDLYHALRRLDPDEIRFLTLPVDSAVRGGERFYEADRPLCEALARELFLPAD